jgi:membrane-bound lytic murein transglycosylase D
MKSRIVIIVSFASCILSAGCFFAGGGRNAALQHDRPLANPQDDIYRRHPQFLSLEQKLNRASAYFYFGDRESASTAAEDLIENVADLKSTSSDSAMCDRLDYLENRARCLLQRMADEALETETTGHMAALIDSFARTNVIEEEIEIEYNEKTTHWIRYFQGSGRRHFSRWLERTGEFKEIIEPILVEIGVPRDLLYLAVIESGLNLGARSHMKAIGPWQFMSGTARLFGLRINWWIDERKDIIASTYAAANYLRYLYGLFGSWQLALASYNAGEHRVAYAMIRQHTNDYWRLKLPAQTTWFVPKFMAALAIGRNPEAYGFERPTDDTIHFDLIEVERPIELRAIAEAANCSINEIKELNPHLKKWSTPPDMVVEVKVPPGTGERCLARLAEMKSSRMVSFVQHKVKRGETLSRIASHYELSVKELKKFNDIGRSQVIRAGNILLIPVKDLHRPARIAGKPSYRTPPPMRDDISRPLLEARQEQKTILYVVKHDDSLVKIAERFHTGLAELRSWNNLSYDSVIDPGDTLTVRLSPNRGSETGAARHPDGPVVQGEDGSGPSSGAGNDNDPPVEDGMKCVTHVVKKGDTLSSISRLYDARLSDILAWNRKTSRSKLYPGEKIRIWLKAG